MSNQPPAAVRAAIKAEGLDVVRWTHSRSFGWIGYAENKARLITVSFVTGEAMIEILKSEKLIRLQGRFADAR